MAEERTLPCGITPVLERALKGLLVGVWEWTPESGAIGWTEVIETIYGFAPGTFGGDFEAVTQHIHPDDRQAWHQDVESCLAGEKDHDLVFRIITADGELRWVHAVGVTERNPRGEIARVVGICVDATEEIRSRDSVSLLYGHSLHLLCEASEDGTIRHANNGWHRLLGHTPQDLVGQNLLDLMHPDDRMQTANPLHGFPGEKPPHDTLTRYRHRDGSYRCIRWSWVLSRQRRLIVAVGVDVTDLIAQDEQLRQAAAVFSSTIEGVLITDLDGVITDINRAFTEVTGYSREECIGRDVSLLSSGRHDEAFFRNLWQEVADTGSWRGEIWNRRKDGSIYPELLTISTVRKNDGSPSGYVSVFNDITAEKQVEARLHHLAHHDALTGLPNRTLLRECVDKRLRSGRRANDAFAVAFIDLDFFKEVNDSIGHDAGDRLLQEVATRLLAHCRADDTVARIGGDEFVMVMGGLTGTYQIIRAIEHISSSFDEPLSAGATEIRMSASIGIAVFPEDGDDADDLLRNADAAMYRAKDRGRNNYQFYSAEMTEAASERLFIEGALRRAIEKDEFFLLYQPKVDLQTGRCLGVEALLRWQHPERGLIGPDDFIPIAERSGLIADIGTWVVRRACADAASWLRDSVDFGHVALNISSMQIADKNFVELIDELLHQHALPASRLQLELTEASLMQESADPKARLGALQDRGIRIAVDDFGTGYSSLAYLKRLPIDVLKIDKSFIVDIPDDEDDMAIASTIIAMAAQLRLGIVAEGVETQAQATFLVGCGCTVGQGFLYSHPLPAAGLVSYLA